MGSSSGCSTPVIDLQNLFPSQSHKLIEACEQWGCLRLINHSIPVTLMTEMKSVVGSLLDLPPEIKRRNTGVFAGSGYVAPTKINPLYESLGLYDIGSPEAVLEFCNQLDASPQQRDTILRYSQAVNDLAMEIGSKIAESMGLGGDPFMGWPCQFRINKYSFTSESVGSSGVQIHTDSGFLTILQDDENVGGLEVMDKKSGEFVPVDPMPGTLLVNLGDLATKMPSSAAYPEFLPWTLKAESIDQTQSGCDPSHNNYESTSCISLFKAFFQVWSNGRFYNVKHRVQCKEATTRLSIALLMLGPKEAVVEAPPELVDTEHPRLYDPILFEDYRKLRLSTGMRAGEALSLLSPSKE